MQDPEMICCSFSLDTWRCRCDDGGMTAHTQYTPCHDLPELAPHGDGPEIALAALDDDVIVAAVAARQAPGARLQEKIDGCWAAGTIDADGRIREITSRAGLPLRFAVRWDGLRVDRRFVGWSIIGELEVGTTRAMRRREERGETLADTLDSWHVYGLVAPDGRRVEGAELAYLLGQLVPIDLRGRMFPVREALPGESWAEFTRSVLEGGGEGVVIRTADGTLYRAKTQVDFDRAVRDVVVERDRRGHARVKALLAVCTSAGARPRYEHTQTVEIPAWVETPRSLRGLVVTIIGSSVDTITGVVRFARITAVREDKAPWECRRLSA